MKKNQLFILAVLIIGLLQSCKKTTPTTTTGKYEEGIFVVNEGNFTQGNASLSFIDEELKNIENNVFYNVNNVHLGDQAQSIAFLDDKVYIVVTGSNKIEVAKESDLERLGTIASDLTSPRYAVEIPGDKAIVTCWGNPSDATDDYLAVIDTKRDVVMTTIPVELGPEQIEKTDNYLFIAHKGAWGTNNLVSVVSLSSLSVIKTISVGDRPNSLVHKDNYLWVLSGGEPSWTQNETGGKLSKIDLNDLTVVQEFDFAQNEHPEHLSLDDDYLYYNIGNKVYKMDKDDTALPSAHYMEYANGGIYNMETNDGLLFITDAKDYQQEGSVLIYDLSNNSLVKDFTAGIIPGDIGFND
jgi:hypothetical protein